MEIWLVVIFVLATLIGVVLFIFLPLAYGTVGYVNTYEAAVVRRFGTVRADLSRNLGPYYEVLPFRLRFYWLMPFGTDVTKVDKRLEQIETERSNVVVNGQELRYSVNGWYGVSDPVRFLLVVNTGVNGGEVLEDTNDSRRQRIEVASLRGAAEVVVKGALVRVLSSLNLSLASMSQLNNEYHAMILDAIQQGMSEKGLHFQDLSFSDMDLPNGFSRDMAATLRVGWLGDAVRANFERLFVDGGDFAYFMDLVAAQFPNAVEAELRAMVLRLMEATIAGLSGGPGFLVGDN